MKLDNRENVITLVLHGLPRKCRKKLFAIQKLIKFVQRQRRGFSKIGVGFFVLSPLGVPASTLDSNERILPRRLAHLAPHFAGQAGHCDLAVAVHTC